MRINCSACHIHVILGQICAGCLLTVEKSTTFWKGKEAKGISLRMAKHSKCNIGNSPTGIYDVSGTEPEWDAEI